MKKAFLVGLFLILSQVNLFAWTSESGGEVVSAQETIVRTSLEATQVLQSDTLTNLYGVTILGGAVNYASFDSGGVQSFRNVTSSANVERLLADQYISWLTTSGQEKRVGVSANNVFTVHADTRILGKLFGQVIDTASTFTTSINTTQIKISGNTTITSVYTTGTCSFTFSNGLLTTATC